MKRRLFLSFLLIVSLAGKSQTKEDTILVKQDTIKPDTIFLPDGVVSHYNDSSFLPTVSIDPTFMGDFAEWIPRNFSPRKGSKGRYWHMRHDGTNSKFTDKDIFDLFNSIRKKPKTR